jgi:hypothetical protein
LLRKFVSFKRAVPNGIKVCLKKLEKLKTFRGNLVANDPYGMPLHPREISFRSKPSPEIE